MLGKEKSEEKKPAKSRFVYDEDDLEGLEFEDDEAKELEEEAKKAGWDESKHRRHPKGSDTGGEFAPKDNGIAQDLSGGEKHPDYVQQELRRAEDVISTAIGQYQMTGELGLRADDSVSEKELATAIYDALIEEIDPVVADATDASEAYWDERWHATAENRAKQYVQGLKAATKKFFKAESVSEELGMVFGWAIVCKEDGEAYFDSQDDHITEKAMLGAAVDFMENSRVLKEMHAGEEQGSVVFAWPLTEDIAKAMGIETKKTGLMIAVKPGNPEILEKFKTGEYSGFSIGGTRLTDEVVKAGWDESKHPRHPKGKEDGGKFAPKDGAHESDGRTDEERQNSEMEMDSDVADEMEAVIGETIEDFHGGIDSSELALTPKMQREAVKELTTMIFDTLMENIEPTVADATDESEAEWEDKFKRLAARRAKEYVRGLVETVKDDK